MNIDSKYGRQVCGPLIRTSNNLYLRLPGQMVVQIWVNRYLIHGRPITRQDPSSLGRIIDKVSIIALKAFEYLNMYALGMWKISYPQALWKTLAIAGVYLVLSASSDWTQEAGVTAFSYISRKGIIARDPARNLRCTLRCRYISISKPPQNELSIVVIQGRAVANQCWLWHNHYTWTSVSTPTGTMPKTHPRGYP